MSAQLHWHREFEIIYVISGKLRIFLNNSEHILNPGDAAFVSGLTLHRAIPENCVYDCVVFDLNMICGHNCRRIARELIPFITGEREITKVFTGEQEELLKSVERLLSSLRNQEPYYEFSVCSTLNEIFLSLLRSNQFTNDRSDRRIGHKKRAISTVIDWIERNYQEKISLKRLSELSDLNEKYLCRVFREFTGQSPTEYVNRLRIERACFEMSVNKKNVTEAALDCGFNDLSYFSRTFKKYKGVLPREFMKQHCEEEK